jgi:hypothetical protein
VFALDAFFESLKGLLDNLKNQHFIREITRGLQVKQLPRYRHLCTLLGTALLTLHRGSPCFPLSSAFIGKPLSDPLRSRLALGNTVCHQNAGYLDKRDATKHHNGLLAAGQVGPRLHWPLLLAVKGPIKPALSSPLQNISIVTVGQVLVTEFLTLRSYGKGDQLTTSLKKNTSL